ncbi:MAG: hypothetical protein UHL70_07070 [Acutalibacteraceae bacterium]|nr:hypothetical protein [Acutalibacteraceae bacterium]
MDAQQILNEAQQLQPELQKCRREIHRHPEVGFELEKTKALVKEQLTEMGYEPKDCGKCGLRLLPAAKKTAKQFL